MVRALVLDDADRPRVAELSESELKERLPEGEVTVRVHASTLNYKDGMVVKGVGKLVKQYPHVPGIDFAGEVIDSDHPGYSPGDRVICTGWGVGERFWGGFADTARVKGDWLVPLPEGLTPWRAMALGTAGLTAMLALMTVLEAAYPTVLRKGFLPISTTRGDRLFVGLLTSAYIHLAWLAVTEASLYIALAISVIWLAILLRWG